MKTYESIPSSTDLHDSPTSYWRMFVLGLIVISPSILNGIMIVYPAIAIPEMNLDISNASWFGSLATLTAPVGSVLIGIIIDKFGRRSALLFCTFPSLLGWILLSWDYSLATTFVGQGLNGISCGSIIYPSQVYAGECVMVNHLSWRDNYLSWLGMGSAFGMCLTLLLAYFVDYQRIAVVSASLAFAMFMLIYAFIPESPLWLYRQGRLGDAEWSQSKLGISQPILRPREASAGGDGGGGGNNDDGGDGDGGDNNDGGDDGDTQTPNVAAWSTFKSLAQKAQRKDVYKPLLIMIVLFVLLTFCGGITIMAYLVSVMGEIDDGSTPATMFGGGGGGGGSQNVEDVRLSESYKYSAIAGLLIFVANCSVCAIVGRVGVKRILSVASFFMALGFTLLAYTTTTATATTTTIRSDTTTLHIVAVWLIIFAFSFGIMNLPNSVLGDIFPADAKGFASVVCVIEFLMTACLLKIHPYLRVAFGGYLYYGYACVSLIGSVYVALFMFETVGKSMDQIKGEFMS